MIKKQKLRKSDTSPICRDAPSGAIGLNLGVLVHIADVITHAKFCDNRFRGFGILIPPILPCSIGIAGRPYNSVSTTLLHCDDSWKSLLSRQCYYVYCYSITKKMCEILITRVCAVR